MSDHLKHFSTAATGVSPLFTPATATPLAAALGLDSTPISGPSANADILFSLEGGLNNDGEEDNDETLKRILNEVNLAVAEDDDDDDAVSQPIVPAGGTTTVPLPRSAGSHYLYPGTNAFPDDEGDRVPFPSFTVSSGGTAADLFPAAAATGHGRQHPAATADSSTGHYPGGGFIVEGSTTSLPMTSTTGLPPPPPPPPKYGTPSLTTTPFHCYSGIPNAASDINKAPPSFAEAIASATPLSLQSRTPLDMTPLTAHYVPPGPAAAPDPILLRNGNGVFLLNPVLASAKPTPPYTPPTGNATPPISPLPRYSLPPAQGPLALPPALPSGGGGSSNNLLSANVTAAGAGFLGASVAQSQQQQQHLQVHGRTRSGSTNNASAAELLPPPPPPPPPPQYGSSPFIGYTQHISSVRGTPSFGAAPPPYRGA